MINPSLFDQFPMVAVYLATLMPMIAPGIHELKSYLMDIFKMKDPGKLTY